VVGPLSTVCRASDRPSAAGSFSGNGRVFRTEDCCDPHRGSSGPSRSTDLKPSYVSDACGGRTQMGPLRSNHRRSVLSHTFILVKSVHTTYSLPTISHQISGGPPLVIPTRHRTQIRPCLCAVEEPGARNPPARIGEREAEWPSYSTGNVQRGQCWWQDLLTMVIRLAGVA
jgi:hypothetical protein